MKGKGIKISTKIEKMHWVSYDTVFAILVGGRIFRLSAEANLKGLKSCFSVDGKKHSSTVKISGIGICLNDGKLKLAFKKDGMLVHLGEGWLIMAVQVDVWAVWQPGQQHLEGLAIRPPVMACHPSSEEGSNAWC